MICKKLGSHSASTLGLLGSRRSEGNFFGFYCFIVEYTGLPSTVCTRQLVVGIGHYQEDL